MSTDPITEDVRSIRRGLAARFDNDIARIFADVRQREASDGRIYVTLPRRPVRVSAGTNGGAALSERRKQP
jgi:hypothetical protein